MLPQWLRFLLEEVETVEMERRLPLHVFTLKKSHPSQNCSGMRIRPTVGLIRFLNATSTLCSAYTAVLQLQPVQKES
jgi:hypothetical protein